MEQTLPTWKESRIDNELPSLAKLFNDSVESMLTKSITDILK
jgi:hypothetical protein